MKGLTTEEYRSHIYTPISRFYYEVFDMEKETLEGLLKEYNSEYLSVFEKECSLAKGAKEVLEKIKACGVAQAIVSSCEKNQLFQKVSSFNIEKNFDLISGADNFYALSKIDRAKQFIEEKYEGKEPKTLVIGDLIHDAELAREIKADCVLALWGHENRVNIYSAGLPCAFSCLDILPLITR